MSFSINNFGTVKLELQVMDNYRQNRETQTIVREEVKAGGGDFCAGNFDTRTEESRWSLEHRLVQHARVYFQHDSAQRVYIGHNLTSVESLANVPLGDFFETMFGIGSCVVHPKPKLKLDITTERKLSSNEQATTEQQLNQQMETVRNQIDTAIDALLCQQIIPGHIVRWQDYKKDQRTIRITELASGRFADLVFINKDQGPKPEEMQILLDGEIQVNLSMSAAQSLFNDERLDIPQQLWAEDFARVFQEDRQCNNPAEQEEIGDKGIS